MRRFFTYAGLALTIGLASCSQDFLNKNPQGSLSDDKLANPEGLDVLLVGAYAPLDGWTGQGAAWQASASNWVYGDVIADDAYKGTDVGDQPQINPIERFQATPDNDYFLGKWRAVYEGIARANSVLRIAGITEGLDANALTQYQAEARFLRAHYHFEAKKMYDNVVFVDETMTTDEQLLIPNDKDVWPQIVADFQYAMENLPPAQDQTGRATKWAAQAFLAKAYMFQGNHAAAKPLLDGIMNEGPFDLFDCYHDNFNTANNNGIEAIFQVQNSVNDGAVGENGNWGDVLNYPYTGGPGTCCGFHQPSQNLVNAYQTDADGLPLLDSFNDSDVKNDVGIASTDAFDPHTGSLDPRLDWTVGRRGIPYLDWGNHPGQDWIRDQNYGGPYSPKKRVFYQSESGNTSTASGWAQGPNANNTNLIRYADVILWRAEVAVDEGDLSTALDLVNQIRTRAAGCVVENEDGTPAANYNVQPYASFPDADYAMKAVQMERRLELAMEGHRFFDLVRWGIAAQVMNDYLSVEATKRNYLTGASFVAGKHEYFPIPQQEIDLSFFNGEYQLKQNNGY
ncbi:RagB/SusD family nutrient uptake outer membrane protein [Pontibacter sp. G13]|uniref:RagB/SusD family nutrient uptake outer membrane protein n=1 Tax=Pontibacter sp. G13 TaxID=3074898 RepID=UPI002889803D|nr:RagB/SusD family nutrient uptake outer membrane protein [Pontibacter sp. G13]WNJ17661.1 RagB/SusD family nutrient uptake outer membrane protein [Pontibacter sp. G13]